ncbi:hypothetical protein PC123_g7964 [Phytophthora cactorum]|nr:hypothetical protein PC123_g7964 [Phytophthora cactorum]
MTGQLERFHGFVTVTRTRVRKARLNWRSIRSQVNLQLLDQVVDWGYHARAITTAKNGSSSCIVVYLSTALQS